MASWRKVRVIAAKEFLSARRNRSLAASSAVMAGLLLVSAVVGFRSHARLKAERERYQELVRQQWLAQPDRHPHRVSHFGDFAFRPKSALGFFEFGVDSFTGNSVFLEPHKQNTANFSEARHSTAMLRFGELTMAMALQVLMPLVIFFLCFAACTAEREGGTLPILLCQGLSAREILLGKFLGYGLAVGAALLPVLAAALLALFSQTGFEVSPGMAARAAILSAAYGVYFALWVGAAVLVSAANRHSRGALLSLLSAWVLLFVLVPRALPNFAKRMFHAPSKPEFDASLHFEAARGGDGHNPGDPAFDKLRQDALARYGAAKVEDLPVNFRGLAMRAGEQHSSEVFQRHFTELQEVYKNQNRLSEWAALLDPYLAIRGLSMALAGTDYYHFTDFQRQAERHRYELIDRLNELQIRKISFAHDKSERIDRAMWKGFAPFRYRPPDIAWALSHHAAAPFGLAVWALALLGLGLRLPLRVE